MENHPKKKRNQRNHSLTISPIVLNSDHKKPSDDEVERLTEDAEKYTAANHLFWGLWGIISVRKTLSLFSFLFYFMNNILYEN